MEGGGVEVLLNCLGHLKPINDKYPLVIFSNTAVAAPASQPASLAAQRIKRKETNFVRCRRTRDNNSWEPPLPLSLPTLCWEWERKMAPRKKSVAKQAKKKRSVLKQKSSQESCNEPNWQRQQQKRRPQRRQQMITNFVSHAAAAAMRRAAQQQSRKPSGQHRLNFSGLLHSRAREWDKSMMMFAAHDGGGVGVTKACEKARETQTTTRTNRDKTKFERGVVYVCVDAGQHARVWQWHA